MEILEEGSSLSMAFFITEKVEIKYFQGRGVYPALKASKSTVYFM